MAEPGPERPAHRPTGQYRPVQRPPSSPVAVTGIVSGVTALVLLLLTAGTSFLIALIASVLALVCGSVARRRIETGEPGRPGQVRAARLLGIAGLGLSVVAMVTWTILSANGFTPQDLIEDLQRLTERQMSR